MTVGVISAIPEEYSKLKWDGEPKTETIINKIFQFGSMNGVKVIAAECGIGKVNASMTTALLLGHFGCDSIIFSGVAGGLNPGTGKVVLNPLGREIVLSQSTEYGPDPPEIAVICI